LRVFADIEAAWVFGSAQDGELHEGSDIDFGVLFRSAPTLDVLAELRAALQEILQVDDIDVVVLNGAGPMLRFEAASGRRLYCRDVHRCAEFVSLAACEYEDDMAMIEKYVKSFAKGEEPIALRKRSG
jgi:predicted nucleotidyltransferase